MRPLHEFFLMHSNWSKGIFILLAVLCLTPWISAPVALVLGFLMTLLIGNPYPITTQKMTSTLLKISVVGLGFGMDVTSALKAGKEGLIFTVISIFAVLSIGFLLTKVFKIDRITGYLISVGTAICGGSAIAAIAPVAKAKPQQISVSLAVIFTLNSVALIIFPILGHLFHLSHYDFGLWCAIAIHDTSSVVGAASKFGTEALQVATTVKLARALWIIPLSIFSVVLFKAKDSKIKIPWFIALFVIAMCLNTYIPSLHTVTPIIVTIAKAGLVLTLFLIGAGLSVQAIKNVGARPLILAALLWVFISAGSLLMIIK